MVSLLRPGSEEVEKEAQGPRVGWIDLYGSWKRSTLELLRVVGTLGVANAAYVTNLPTDPESARVRWAQVSYVALEAGLGLNEN